MSKTGEGTGGAVEGMPLKRAEALVLVMDTPKGRGVFASRDIPARTVVEISPVLVLDPVENEEHIRKTELYNYTYNWPSDPPIGEGSKSSSPSRRLTTQAVIFGLGSMFNHSTLHQNVGWERDLENLLIKYTTLRDVKAGEELCISYGSQLTFKDSDVEEIADGLEDWIEVLNIIDLN